MDANPPVSRRLRRCEVYVSPTEAVAKEQVPAVTPGFAFGEAGEGWVRFALIENEERTKQALHGLKRMLGA